MPHSQPLRIIQTPLKQTDDFPASNIARGKLRQDTTRDFLLSVENTSAQQATSLESGTFARART